MRRCKDCGEADVRTEDGRHDWDVCGRHLLRQRDKAQSNVKLLRAALEKLVVCGHNPSDTGCNCYRKANAALKEVPLTETK